MPWFDGTLQKHLLSVEFGQFAGSTLGVFGLDSNFLSDDVGAIEIRSVEGMVFYFGEVGFLFAFDLNGR